MAEGYSLQTLPNYGTSPPQMGDGTISNGERRSSTVILTGASLQSQGAGFNISDTILVAKIPMGAQFVDIQMQSDTVLTGATLEFGNGTTPLAASIVNATKYGSVAVPAANTLYTLRPVAARIAGPYAADEFIYITVIGAALPSSFNMEIQINFQVMN